MVKEITFDQLPAAVTLLSEKLDYIEKLLSALKQPLNDSASSKPLILEEAAEFLSLEEATVYSKVSRGELPHYKRGKRLYFCQDELWEYVKGDENEDAVDPVQYLKKRRVNHG